MSLAVNIKRIVKKLLHYLLNNIFVNNIIIFLRLENYFKKTQKHWISNRVNNHKSLEENAGFSNYKDVQDARDKVRSELKRIKRHYLCEGAKVLDIGCGPGLFLSDFEKSFELTGIDLSKEMISIALERLPHAKFSLGDFLTVGFNEKFNLIYSISVLQYVTRMNMDKFFKKTFALLEPDGILFVSYPHALSFWDTLYYDLEYISYSPAFIQKIVSRYLKIIEHHHIFDGRVVGKYDTKVYKNPELCRTYKNSYLLIAQNIY